MNKFILSDFVRATKEINSKRELVIVSPKLMDEINKASLEWIGWVKENFGKKDETKKDRERAWKEFVATGQCHFKYPTTEDEYFKKDDNGTNTRR